MVRLRQTVQGPLRQEGGSRREQNRQFVRNRDELRPREQRLTTDVPWVVHDVRIVQTEEADRKTTESPEEGEPRNTPIVEVHRFRDSVNRERRVRFKVTETRRLGPM